MPSDQQQAAPDDAPPDAANVATAYPPAAMRSSTLPRLLGIVTLLGAILALVVHKVDHRATKAVKSALNKAVSSASGKTRKPDAATSGRLAVCFSGHVGSLASVSEQNLAAIRAIDPSAAIFYYLDLKDDYYHETSGKHFTETHGIGDLQPVFDAAKSVAVKTFTASDVSVPPQSACHKKEAETREHYSHNYMQFYAAAGCYEMIKDAELESGERFGWILQLQPNMNILVKKPPTNVESRIHLSGSAMALIPRHMAETYYSIVEAFSHGKCTPLDDMGEEPCKNYSYPSDSTECLIIKWLKQAGMVPSNGVYLNRRIIYPDDSGE